LLIIQSADNCVSEIEKALKQESIVNSIKSVTVTNDSCESIFEIRTEDKSKMLQKIKSIDTVNSVSVVSYQGEYSD
jgi:hypothetical protein